MALTGAKAFGTGGLSLVQNSNEVKAVLHAQASKGNVDVISSPSLMVLNNQEAKINVGQQVPISTGSSSIPLSGGVSAAPLLNPIPFNIKIPASPWKLRPGLMRTVWLLWTSSKLLVA